MAGLFDFEVLEANRAPRCSDLALGCPVVASSIRSLEKQALNVVDSNPTTRWTSEYFDEQWISVDLGRVYTLSNIAVKWEVACAERYLLQGKTAHAEKWTTMASEHGRPGWVTTSLPPVSTARWVRLFLQKRATEYGFSIWELRVHESRATAAAQTSPHELSESATVHVSSGLTGDFLCDIDMEVDLSIRRLKELIQAKVGIAASEQKLLELDTEGGPARQLTDRELCRPGGTTDVTLMRINPAHARDRERVMRDMRCGVLRYEALDEDLRSDPDIVIAALEDDRLALRHATPQVRGNRNIVLEALRLNGFAIQHASTDLRRDPEIVACAIHATPMALQYAEYFMGDRNLVLLAVRSSGIALRYASPELSADREVASASINAERHPGLALAYVADTLKDNRDLVLQAMKHDGTALKYASARLRGDREVVIAALKTSKASAIEYASNGLRSDRHIALTAVKLDGMMLQYMPEDLRCDQELALAAVKTDGLALRYVAHGVHDYRHIATTAVSVCGSALQYAHGLTRDHDMICRAIQQDPSSIQFAGEGVIYDEAFRKAALQIGVFNNPSFECFLLIEPEVAIHLCSKGLALLIDARSRPEYRAKRPSGAVLAKAEPFIRDPDGTVFANAVAHQAAARKQLLIVYSTMGSTGNVSSRCVQTARELRERPEIEAHQVFRLRGGFNRWLELDLPVEQDADWWNMDKIPVRRR